MHFSKLPSNPSLTKLVSFVPLKNHTPWFVLGLGKGGLCFTETLFNKKLEVQGFSGRPGKLTGGPQPPVM